MKVLKYNQARNSEIIEVETPKPEGNQILTKSLYCNISAGTEMGFYRGTAPQMNSDIEPGWFFKEKPGNLNYPMQSDGEGVWWMGYANVSQVLETGPDVKNIKKGDIVFAQTTHKDHQLLPEDAVNLLPKGINLEHASLTALIEITFNGILDAGIKLKDTVVVYGLGTLGQLLVQMAKKSGARVIGVDSMKNRMDVAKTSGADLVIDFTKEDAAKRIYTETKERGADVVFEVSGNIKALPDAMRAVAYNGKVTVLSFYQDPATPVNFGNEFHHKRIQLKSSQILGISPELSNTWNMSRRRQAAIELVSELNIEPLISHRFDFDNTPKALEIIDQNPEKCNAVILKY